MWIPKRILKKIEKRIDLVALMQANGVVIKASSVDRALALCPFHEDKKPSLSIDKKKKIYHCFGCGARGNIFTYIQQTEGIDYFPSVVRRAAEIAGLNWVKELHEK